MTSHPPISLMHRHRKVYDAPYFMIHDQYVHIHDFKLTIISQNKITSGQTHFHVIS